MRLVYFGFVLTGTVTTILGPVLPLLSHRWSLEDAAAGLLFTAQFLGSLLGVALSSTLASRWGPMTLLAIGSTLKAVGISSLLPAGWPVGLAFVFCYGVGLGFAIPVTNVLVAMASRNRTAALNLVNVAWVTGAIGGPAALALLTKAGRAEMFLPALGLALALFAAAFARLAWTSRLPAATPKETAPQQRLWRTPALILFVVLFFLYSGTENSLGGWIASYAQRISSSSNASGELAPAFFWTALLVGRLLATPALMYISEPGLLLSGLALAALSLVAMLASRTAEAVVLCAAVSGLGLAPIFPTTMSVMAHTFGAATSRAAGPAFAAAALGGAIVPWLVGAVSTLFDSLRAGLGVPLASCVATLVLSISLAARSPSPPGGRGLG